MTTNPSGPIPHTKLNLPSPSEHAQHFAIDPTVVYLNHGSFGACPKRVMQAQQAHRDRVEADAMQFYIHDLWHMMDRSRASLAKLIKAQPQDIVFLPNATTAVTTVINNTDLNPDDEVIVTNFEYTACANNFKWTAENNGAKLIVADLPWDPIDEDSAIEAIMSKVTDRTKLVLVSLITSATALRLPVERLIQRLKEHNIDTLLDAAHGPGCVPMDVDSWGAAYTTGNAHKWLCAPKGAAFLHVRADKQTGFRPMTLSNDAMNIEPAIEKSKRSEFNHEFDYMGTDDRTAMISIADAIETLEDIFPTGINGIMDHNAKLCIQARALLCKVLGVEPSVPDSMLGPLATINIPAQGVQPRQLRQQLFNNHRIQTMIVPSPTADHPMVRLSPQIYNTLEQYEYLAQAIKAEISK